MAETLDILRQRVPEPQRFPLGVRAVSMRAIAKRMGISSIHVGRILMQRNVKVINISTKHAAHCRVPIDAYYRLVFDILTEMRVNEDKTTTFIDDKTPELF